MRKVVRFLPALLIAVALGLAGVTCGGDGDNGRDAYDNHRYGGSRFSREVVEQQVVVAAVHGGGSGGRDGDGRLRNAPRRASGRGR